MYFVRRTILCVAVLVGCLVATASPAAAVAPLNDNLANAQPVSVPSTTAGTNANASRETGEPITIANTSPSGSVWYRFVATSTGKVSVTTIGSSFDTVLGVYVGTRYANLAEIAHNDDTGYPSFSPQSSLTFTAYAGEGYLVRVEGFNAGAVGNVVLNVTVPTAFDSADNFAAATTVVGGVTQFSNVGATIEAGEPIYAGGATLGASVWFNYVAPRTGPITIDTCGSSFDTVLAVYTGSTPAGLTQVVYNDDNSAMCGLGHYQSSLSLSATGGVTYRIQLGGFASGPSVATGSGVLHIDIPGDVTAPTISVLGPLTTSPLTTAEFDLVTNEWLAGSFKCGLDGATPVDCSSFYTPTAGDGSHVLVVSGVDLNGNAGQAQVSFTLDTTAPVTSLTVTPTSSTSTSASIEFTANETATFECSVDSAAFASCTSPLALSGLALGSHTVAVRATDTLGHVEQAPYATAAWDVQAPPSQTTTPAAGGGDTGTTAPAVMCKVPKLAGLTLAKAKKALAAAHCKLGKVSYAFSAKVKKGKVVSSKPKASSTAPAGSKVALVISKGPKPAKHRKRR